MFAANPTSAAELGAVTITLARVPIDRRQRLRLIFWQRVGVSSRGSSGCTVDLRATSANPRAAPRAMSIVFAQTPLENPMPRRNVMAYALILIGALLLLAGRGLACRYDPAGRTYTGINPYNLPVPPHDIVTRSRLRIGHNAGNEPFSLEMVEAIRAPCGLPRPYWPLRA
jgi:hypothetical protein